MAVKIFGVDAKSKIGKKRIKAGDFLLSINGESIDDFLDYRFYGDEERVLLEFLTSDNKRKAVNIKRSGGCDSLGMSFETFLMDKKRRCKNACIFCFIDQLPKGLRESLYFKDDDFRLSFLFGNYISLTNLTEHDVRRIIKMHLSPVNVSVHTMNPELRNKIMRNPKAGESLSLLKRFSDAGLKINAQLVLCPGINDGGELEYSLKKLSELSSIKSIAAVPAGLTKYREGLYPLKSYDKESASAVIDIIDDFNGLLIKRGREKTAYPSDEFFLLAERETPPCAYYGDFPQLDNGVGGEALLERDFTLALENGKADSKSRRFAVATGEAAFSLIKKLSASFCEKYKCSKIDVYRIPNKFFGGGVSVAGLITGGDLISVLREYGFNCGRLLLPSVMFKSCEERIFLDGVEVDNVEKELNTHVSVVGSGGSELFDLFYSS